MLKQKYGRIVNIASIAGKEGNPNAAAYSASKAGVIALTKSLGKELPKHNISVNCITPSACRTRIFDQLTQQHIDYMLSKIPRGRFVELDEIASMVAWLVSAENSYTTGSVSDGKRLLAFFGRALAGDDMLGMVAGTDRIQELNIYSTASGARLAHYLLDQAAIAARFIPARKQLLVLTASQRVYRIDLSRLSLADARAQ